MKKILLLFSLFGLATMLYAQDDDKYVDALSVTELSYTNHYPKLDMTPYTILNTLEKPKGYIAVRDGVYSIILKEKKSWAEIPLETIGNLNNDSTKFVNLNDQGNKELVLYFSYYEETEGPGILDAEIEESYRIYIYDLDKKELILEFIPRSFYKKVEEFYLDSTGARIDKEERHDQIYKGAKPEHKDSLDLIWEDFLDNSKSSAVKNLRIDGTYLLEKNKITLTGKVEKKDFTGDPVITESRSVYVWKDNEWQLVKEK